MKNKEELDILVYHPIMGYTIQKESEVPEGAFCEGHDNYIGEAVFGFEKSKYSMENIEALEEGLVDPIEVSVAAYQTHIASKKDIIEYLSVYNVRINWLIEKIQEGDLFDDCFIS